jgi:hypothetical protein
MSVRAIGRAYGYVSDDLSAHTRANDNRLVARAVASMNGRHTSPQSASTNVTMCALVGGHGMGYVVRAATTMCLDAPAPAALADRPSRQPGVAHKSCESIQVGVSGNTVAQSQETQAQCCNVCDSVGMGVC